MSQNFRVAELSSIQPLSLQQKSIVFFMLALLPKLNEINIKLKRILGKKVALSSLNLMIPIFTVLTRYDYTLFLPQQQENTLNQLHKISDKKRLKKASLDSLNLNGLLDINN